MERGHGGDSPMIHSTPHRTAVSLIATNVLFLVFAMAPAGQAVSQPNDKLQALFRHDMGLSDAEIADIRSGKAVARIMPPRTAQDVFLFGAIYIRGAPERYVEFRNDLDRFRKLPGFLALGVFRDPPQASDLDGFTFDGEDI